MIEKKQKYISYGCGVLVGILLVGLCFKEKFITRKPQEVTHDPVVHKIILGEDKVAKHPMPVELAIQFQDYEVNDRQYLRVLTLKDERKGHLLRIEETIKKTKKKPGMFSEKLLLRRQMLGDKVLVRLKDPAMDINSLDALLQSLQLSVDGPGRRKGLYYLKLGGKAEDPNYFSEITQQLSAHEAVDRVVPVYINANVNGV